MPELSIENVIRSLTTDELVDAVETFVSEDSEAGRVWLVLNEIERRDPAFEI